MVQKPKTFLIVFLIILAAYRLLLSGSGQRYWPDEYRYLHAMHFVDELSKGNPKDGLKWIFGTTFDVAARPGFMFLATIPVFLQGLAHLLFGIQPSDAAFYRIPAIFNVAVSVGVAILFYRIVFLLSRDHALALLAVVVQGLLVNTNLYVRHLVPYDWALLIILASLNVILSPGIARDAPRYQAVIAGLLTGLGITTYTPYWPIIIILAVALIVTQSSWHHVPTFTVAFLSVIIMWEMIAQIGGLSYIGRFTEAVVDASAVTVDVPRTFGGPIFLPFYSLRVEGIVGAALLALLGCFWVGAVRGKYGRGEVVLVGAATAVYLVYGTIGTYTHNYIFHFFGRLLHMYFPFLVLASILALKLIPGSRLQAGVAAALVLVSVVSFVPTAATALMIRYPRDVERELVASLAPGAKICNWVRDDAGRIEEPAIECDITNAKALVIRYPRDTEGAPATKICNRVKDVRGRIQEPASDCDFVLENFRHLYPTSLEIVDAMPPRGFVLSAVHNHPLQFAPYWLEDFTPDDRTFYATYPAQMRVYARAIPLNKDLPSTNGAALGGR